MHIIDENIAGIGLNLLDNIKNNKLVMSNVTRKPSNLSAKKESPKISINCPMNNG